MSDLLLKRISFLHKGQKRSFLIAGITNVILTNLCLQFLLFNALFEIRICTFISQVFNMVFGYGIYSKFIFKVKKVAKFKFISKYLILMFVMWLTNVKGIYIGSSWNISESISALIMIPVLAVMSYLIQKYWIFI